MSSKIKDDDLAVHANVLLRLKYPVMLALVLNLAFVIRVPFAQSKDTVVAQADPANSTEAPIDGGPVDPPVAVDPPVDPPVNTDPEVPNPFIVVSPAVDPPPVNPVPTVTHNPPVTPPVNPNPPVVVNPTVADPVTPDEVPTIDARPPIVFPPQTGDPVPTPPEWVSATFSQRLIRIARGLVDENAPRAPSPFEPTIHSDPAITAPPIEPFDDLVLINPPETNGAVHFLVDGELYTLYPGEQTRLLNQTEWMIQFHRGAEFGEATVRFGSGSYRFSVNQSHGWTLSKSTD